MAVVIDMTKENQEMKPREGQYMSLEYTGRCFIAAF